MKKKIVSIILVVIIIILIFGIWIIKNNSKKQGIEEQSNAAEQINEDFMLEFNSRVINMEKLKSYNLPIIIDFGADYCMPCRQMEPNLKQIHKEMQGKAIIKYADVGKNPTIARGYPVELIPTQLFINSDGTPYNPANAEGLGLNIIKDNDGNHIYTIHIGILTVEQMKLMLREMGINERNFGNNVRNNQ